MKRSEINTPLLVAADADADADAAAASTTIDTRMFKLVSQDAEEFEVSYDEMNQFAKCCTIIRECMKSFEEEYLEGESADDYPTLPIPDVTAQYLGRIIAYMRHYAVGTCNNYYTFAQW